MKQKKAAKKKFERDLIKRGEAAPADEEGRIPSGATHEIVGKDESGAPVIKRRRYSIK